MCLGLWYQEGNIFGVSFWERRKTERVDGVLYFFLKLINFTSCNFDTGSINYTNVIGANMLSAAYPSCLAIKLQLCYRRMSSVTPMNDSTFTPLFLKMSVMLVTHWCYLKKSKLGT